MYRLQLNLDLDLPMTQIRGKCNGHGQEHDSPFNDDKRSSPAIFATSRFAGLISGESGS